MIKQCPFCGGSAKIEELWGNHFKIVCSKCRSSTGSIEATIRHPLGKVEEELKNLWNNRKECNK